jgi:hypothetical protein
MLPAICPCSGKIAGRQDQLPTTRRPAGVVKGPDPTQPKLVSFKLLLLWAIAISRWAQTNPFRASTIFTKPLVIFSMAACVSLGGASDDLQVLMTEQVNAARSASAVSIAPCADVISAASC